MSSSLVTCENCKKSYDILTYKDETDFLHPVIVSSQKRPYLCPYCNKRMDFNDEHRPWLGWKVLED